MFWGNYLRSGDDARQAEQASNAANEATLKVAKLEGQVAKLTLVSHALFELMAERSGITEADLIAKVSEIDAREQATAAPGKPESPEFCEQCGRSYSKRHHHCFYCGHVNHVTKAF